MRMDLSLLLLATPLTPPMVPALGAPNGDADPRPPAPCGVLDCTPDPNVDAPAPVWPRPVEAVPPPGALALVPGLPGVAEPPDAPVPPGTAPTGRGTKSSSVIGSLNF